MSTVSATTLGGRRARGEFNRALRRLSRLHQSSDAVHEVTLKVFIRRSPNRGKKQIKWSVRTNIATGRKEISNSQGKATTR